MRTLIIEACLSGDTKLFLELRKTFPIELLQSELAGLAERYQKRFQELMELTDPKLLSNDVPSPPEPPPPPASPPEPPPPEPPPPEPPPPEEKQWIPVLGERVFWLHFTTWRLATVIRCPAPDNGFNKWEVRLDSGFEVYVWNIEEMRQVQ